MPTGEPLVFADGFEVDPDSLPPTGVTLSAAPLTLSAGGQVTLNWNSNQATGCVGVSPAGFPTWSGAALAPSGSRSLSLSTPGTYVFQLYCFNDNGQSPIASSSTVTVTPPDSGGACVGGGSNPPTGVAVSVSTTTASVGAPIGLSWTSTAAAGCFGMGPAGVPGWSGVVLPATRSVGNPLMLTLSAPGAYTFGLYCFNQLGASPTVSSQTVTVVGTPPPPADFCSEHYDGIVRPIPSEAQFHAHGFTRVWRSVGDVWGVPLGAYGPPTFLPGNHLPGPGAYLSIPLSLPDGLNQVRFSWTEPQGQGPAGAVAMTISPCAGDFRPAQGGSSDVYLGYQCRSTGPEMSGNRYIARAGSGLAGCPVPAGKVVYLNIATYDLYHPWNPMPTCPGTGVGCGVLMSTQ